MQAEQQSKPVTPVAETQSPPDSGESKASNRGLKRPGAGRKPNLAKRLLKGFSREAVHEAVTNMDVGVVIQSLMKSKSDRTKLETLIFVRDTLIGRPAQNVSLFGGVLHAHTAWRPLASLSDDEMEMLDKLTKKLAGPVLDVAQDAPQNQIESKPAIEAALLPE